ncbi:MAG: ABC transporter ATP-binding protein [Geobacter sp.]|nr:MAG: ABC transporter ATP-binding protein [Geobacter sp.]
MIELKNLTKWYKTKKGRHYVFRDVSVVFPEGKSIGILGPNGAGKSTLMRMISGTEYPNSGRLITSKKISWPVGLSGGFQGSMSGRDNIKFICRIYGLSRDEIRQKIDYVQEFAEIGDYFDMPVNTYSSGMKGKISFGLSMAFDFDYYLVDECTSVGDQTFKHKSNKLFDEKRQKANIIMVSHSPEVLIRNTDIGAVIQDGKINLLDDIKDAAKFYGKINKR